MKITKIWVVHNPSPVSELEDVLHETDVHGLAPLIIGTGLDTWRHENTALYTEEGEAKRDAVARMKKQPKEASRIVGRYKEALYRRFLAMSVSDAAKILGVKPDASPEEIHKAYRLKAFENHPDRGGDPNAMVAVNVAKEILEGKQRPSRDEGGGGGYSYPEYTPSPRPKPKKIEVTFEEALSKAGVPSGVEWVFKTEPSFGGHGDTSVSACVVYGKTDSQHVFVGLHHYRSQNAFTGEDVDVWTINTKTTSLSKGVAQVAPVVIREMFKDFEGLRKGYNAKVQLLGSDFKLGSNSISMMGLRSMAFKDAMVQLGEVGEDSDWANRKLSVVIRLDRGEGGGDAISLTINGKEFPLSAASVEFITKKSRVLNAIFGTYYYFMGDKKDVTRSKNGKSALKWLSEKLTDEPQELRDLLLKASEQK